MPDMGGFVVTDSHDAVLVRYALRDGGMVRLPMTDFTVLDYPDAAGTRLEFITADIEGLSDSRDPDDVLYSGRVRIAHRQQAYLALQELYNLTGLRLDFCYCTANASGVYFSLLPDGFAQRSFFAASLGEDYGGSEISGFRLAWRELAGEWSPLVLAEAVCPEPWLPPGTILQWYYDRLKIFHTGEAVYGDRQNLYLVDGAYYAGEVQETEWGPALVSFSGPYTGIEMNQ